VCLQARRPLLNHDGNKTQAADGNSTVTESPCPQ
jgi:hypothetical protein